jgi:hypothetical protein
LVTAALAQGCNEVGFVANPFSAISNDDSGENPNPGPSPQPTVVPSPSPSASPSPSVTPKPTVVPSPSPTVIPSPSPSVTPQPTVIPSPSPSVTPSPTVVPSPSPSVTPKPTVTPTPSPSVTPSPTVVPSPSPSVTPTPTVTPSPTPTRSPAAEPTPTPTPSPTPSSTPSPTPSVTPSPTPSATPTPTIPACIEGPEIRKISDVTDTSLVALFHGVGITEIAYQIFDSSSVLKASGSVKPEHNHPTIKYPSLAHGNYKLVFKAIGCVGGSEMPFAVEPPSVVCDPFGNGGEGGKKNGLEARLTYLPADNYSSSISGDLRLSDFHPDAPRVTLDPARLVLSQLNVPTRSFTEGFSDEASGTTLANLDGEKLIEFFSIRAQSSLVLDDSDPEGDYELAILSDDGSILELDPSGEGKTYSQWINNDGTHPNKLGCASQTIAMKRGKEIPIKMNYFQGPRERITLMMLWRMKNSSQQKESECGHERDDSYYFKPSASSASAPTSKYQGLLNRGWKVLKTKNYVLPGDNENPCLK